MGYFSKEVLSIKPELTIILGHSLGSAPSIHLAINKKFLNVKAIILLSPIASGIKLVNPEIKNKDLEKIDVFCNIKKINEVSCPIFIIHGQKDDVIPVQQSYDMASFMKYPYEWHPRNGDHYNILTKYRTKFFQKCKFFFEYLNYFTYNKNRNVTNSIETYNCEKNDRIYKNLFSNKNDVMRDHLEENYITSYPINGLSQKEISKLDIDNIQNFNQVFQNSFVSIKCLQNTNQQKENGQCPFEDNKKYLMSTSREDILLTPNKSGDIYIPRDSKDSNMIIYRDHRDIEDHYNRIVKNN